AFADAGCFRIHVSMEDNAPGISPDHLSKLFHDFCHVQCRKIVRAELRSGLLQTKAIVDLNGGTINIVNRHPANGSSARVEFVFVSHRGDPMPSGMVGDYETPVLPA